MQGRSCIDLVKQKELILTSVTSHYNLYHEEEAESAIL